MSQSNLVLEQASLLLALTALACLVNRQAHKHLCHSLLGDAKLFLACPYLKLSFGNCEAVGLIR